MIERQPPPLRPSNVEALRRDIDDGGTGDKVAFPDPAAAPLGADEEAAGTPLKPEDVALAREQEGSGDSRDAPGVTEQRRESLNAQTGRPWVGIAVALGIIVIGAILFAVIGG